MKTKLFSILTLLLCVCSGAWAEDFVLSQSTATEFNGNESDAKAQTFVSNSQTFSIAKGSTSGVAGKGAETAGNTLKLSKNATYTITLPTGFTITAINFKGYCHDTGTDAAIDKVNSTDTGWAAFPTKEVANTEASWADLTYNIIGDASSASTVSFHVANKSQIDVIITITGTAAATSSKTASSCAFATAEPSITFPATSTYSQEATTAAEYDGTVTYALSANTCGATIEGTTVTVTGAGSVTVTATAPETETYASSSASYTLTINDSRTALIGAWTPTSVSEEKDAEAPSNPTFAVSGEATLGTDYTVTYEEVSDENNIVTTSENDGITSISTSTAGTATIRATVALTETGAASYYLSSTTYDITVSITSVATLFSMTDVTGPTTAIPHRDGEWDVEATFSAGGSATVYNGHSSSDAVMCDGYINVNGSGGSYLHIVFPTKLQIGDIISAEGTQKGADTGDISWRISATSSINNKSNNKTCPYTVTDGDGLAGATDLYIGKNSGAFIESITISGASDASDLTITSGKTVTIGTGSTSNIIYTSSNTTTPTFVSSATSVATVSDAGVITAVAPGTAVITITQASDGTIREAAAKVTVTVEKTQKATEVTGEFVLDTDNGTQSSGSYVSTDGSVSLEGGISNGSNTYNDLKNSHFKHSSNITFTLPSNYPVSTVWFVGYRNSASSTATIKLTKVDGASVTEQSGTVGGSDAIPAADWVGFELATAATKSMVINFSGECRGYFILNPDAQNIALTQIGTNYYASYYSAGEMTITGATAYTAELDAENSKLTLTACEGGVVPARTGVILIGNNASATATPSFTGATKEQGDLIGVAQKEVAMANYYVGSTSAAEKVFVLGAENSKAGLYKFTGTSLGVNKAYLYNETLASAGARSLSFDFADETTAINGISTDTVKDELRKFFDNGRLLIQKKGMKYNAAGQQMK